MSTASGNKCYGEINSHGGGLTARSRLEERFVPDHIGTSSNPGDPSPANSTMAARYRQLIKASIPLSFAPGFSYIIQDEAFVSLNDTDWVPRRGFDQNRFFTGLRLCLY